MVAQYYGNLIELSTKAFEDLKSDATLFPEFTKVHNFSEDYEKLSNCLVGRPEKQMLDLASQEFQFALYSVAIAQYRNANRALRLFLEMSLASILYSAHEIDIRRWQKGQLDIVWQNICSPDNGVYSKSFISAFWPDMKEYGPEHLAMAQKLYRECSEYVHGNLQSFDGTDAGIKFDSTQLASWMERADTARLTLLFAFLARFLPLLAKEHRDALEQIALENFGHLPAVQAIYDEAEK